MKVTIVQRQLIGKTLEHSKQIVQKKSFTKLIQSTFLLFQI